MKRLTLLFFLFALISFFSTPSPTFAQSCSYGSTQARVQLDTHDSWKQYLIVECDRAFNVGSFHNNTGQFANDTKLVITGPNGFRKESYNGGRVTVQDGGNYKLWISTKNQSGSACEDNATVEVRCNAGRSTPTPRPTVTPQCWYQSTESRVQRDTSHDWVSRLELSCGQQFIVGSFHDGTGQWTSDSNIEVTGPNSYRHTAYNGERLTAERTGTYSVRVTTPSQRGSKCENTSTVVVRCDNQGTDQCPYRSTQAGVRTPRDNNTTEGWKTNLNISCGQPFQIGSAHDSRLEYASDTRLTIRQPNGGEHEYHNGDVVTAVDSGTYSVKVSTRDKSGSACENTARVYVSCTTPRPSATPRPSVTPRPSPTPPPGLPTNPEDNPYQCRYQSTEARMRSTNTDWQEKLELSCGDTFEVGGFHNTNLSQLTNDLVMKVRNPSGREMYLHNGAAIKAWQPGTFRLNVYTIGQAGKACTGQAQVRVRCDGWNWSWSRWFNDWWDWWR